MVLPDRYIDHGSPQDQIEEAYARKAKRSPAVQVSTKKKNQNLAQGIIENFRREVIKNFKYSMMENSPRVQNNVRPGFCFRGLEKIVQI